MEATTAPATSNANPTHGDFRRVGSSWERFSTDRGWYGVGGAEAYRARVEANRLNDEAIRDALYDAQFGADEEDLSKCWAA